MGKNEELLERIAALEKLLPAMPRPQAEPMKAYDDALALIKKIDDADFRSAAIEAVILRRVRRETGSNDPAGALAMELRRAASAS